MRLSSFWVVVCGLLTVLGPRESPSRKRYYQRKKCLLSGIEHQNYHPTNLLQGFIFNQRQRYQTWVMFYLKWCEHNGMVLHPYYRATVLLAVCQFTAVINGLSRVTFLSPS